MISYIYQLSYFTEKIGENNERIYHSICSFSPIPEYSYLEPAKETELVCDSFCEVYNGTCVQNSCVCESGYFGSSCGARYYNLNSGYSKSFKVLQYSLTFFKMISDKTVKVENSQKNIHIFYSSNPYPSFLEFQGYYVGNTSKFSLNEFEYFTVFCLSRDGCKFKVKIDDNEDSTNSNMVIISCSLIGGVVLLGVIFAAIRFSRSSGNKSQASGIPQEIINVEQPKENKEQEHNKIKVIDSNDILQNIDYFAPLYNDENIIESCSICLNNSEVQNETRRLKICLHLFNSHCLGDWLKTKDYCPNCNLKIE